MALANRRAVIEPASQRFRRTATVSTLTESGVATSSARLNSDLARSPSTSSSPMTLARTDVVNDDQRRVRSAAISSAACFRPQRYHDPPRSTEFSVVGRAAKACELACKVLLQRLSLPLGPLLECLRELLRERRGLRRFAMLSL